MGRKALHVKHRAAIPDDIRSDTQDAEAQSSATRTKRAVP
ncbi:hypothetical protein CAMGR0001_1424 [Campylobacter gracilis RM3268]|uniref:Uncharacterized protein n=1 Tax=Campylobacter gracilis RM3268 TaxID=553220 RepID=C8PJM4_9BACT|nr:hypothetical protein CAMGR0001_1424 [Campylobacter gracilis RM3268]